MGQYKLEQIWCDFADLIEENISKEKIVQEEVLDPYSTNVYFLSNNPFHCINLSKSLCHSFDFHCTYHDWVVHWLEKSFLARFHHYGKNMFPYFYINMVRFHSIYWYINFILLALIHSLLILIWKHWYHAFWLFTSSFLQDSIWFHGYIGNLIILSFWFFRIV